MRGTNGPAAPPNGRCHRAGPLGAVRRPLAGRRLPFAGSLPATPSHRRTVGRMDLTSKATSAPNIRAAATTTGTAPAAPAGAAAATAGPATAATRPRWPYVGPGQQTLLWASILITVGAFLPWLMTSFGTFSGMRGAGTWTVFAGVIGIGASLMRRRRAVLVHAVGIAAIAIALPVWQVVHLLGTVGVRGWLPGIGLLMTLVGGVAIARATGELRAGG